MKERTWDIVWGIILLFSLSINLAQHFTIQAMSYKMEQLENNLVKEIGDIIKSK